MININKWISSLSSEQQRFFELLNKEKGNGIPSYIKTNTIEKVEEKEYYQASHAQKRMYIMNKLEGLDPSYNISGAYIVSGKLNKNRLNNVFKQLIYRHEALRTSFEIVEGEPIQKIKPYIDFEVEYLEISGQEIEGVLKNFIRPFDLSKAPLIRIGVIKLSDIKHLLIYDMSHIISDGVSANILITEFLSLYNNEKLKEQKIQYKDFSEWQNKLVESDEIAKQERFWLDMYKGEISLFNLPRDYQRKKIRDYQGESYDCMISDDILEKLKMLAAKENMSMFSLLLSAYKVMLSKVADNDDIIVGIPSEGRNHPDIQNVIGMFVNTLPLRSKPAKLKTFTSYMKEVRDTLAEAIDNQDYQFEMLLHKLGDKVDMANNPLFTTIFNSQNFLVHENNINESSTDHLLFKPFKYENKTTTSDLTIYFSEYNDYIEFSCTFQSSLYKKSTIKYLMDEYIKLLRMIAIDPTKLIKDYKIFNREQVETNHKNPYIKVEEYKVNQSIVGYFEEQVEKFALNIAIKNSTTELTYDMLNKKANRLAQTILEAKIIGDENKPTALLFDHRSDMITGIIGAAKSGSIFLPLDPNFPEERLAYTLKDSGTDVILCNSANIFLANKLKEVYCNSIHIINIESIREDILSDNLKLEINPEQPAFILYTSGSTGNPKGVVHNHLNFLRLMRNYIDSLNIQSKDRLLLLTSYSHAVGIIDIFSTLLTGGMIYLFDLKSDGNFRDLVNVIEKEKITIFHSVPTIYRYFTNILKEGEIVNHCRLLILGGEAVIKNDVERYKKFFNNGCKLVNFLGATEVLVASFEFIDKDTEITRMTVSAGYPVDEVKVFIINEDYEEAGIYEIGEIVYSSDCLALGYWNSPDETNKVFVPNPITKMDRVYRSGDIGRILTEGSIEYLGRKDNQIKIRGQRVELNEIESILDDLKAVKKSIVVSKKNDMDENVVVAYFIPEEREGVDLEIIKQEVAKKAPQYMVPTYFIKLDKLPLTPNGKIDRKKLPDISKQEVLKSKQIAPTNKIEKLLVRIWNEVLEIDEIGTNESFFNIGGNSLKVLKLHHEIDKIYPGKLTVVDIFSNPTISTLASKLHSSNSSKKEEIYVKSIDFPAEYFSHSELEHGFHVFNITISNPLLNKIKAISISENLRVIDISVAMFVYLFAEISKQDVITVQTILKEKGVINPLTIDLNNIDRIEKLLQIVGEKAQQPNEIGAYQISEISKLKSRDTKDFSIRPLITNKLLSSMTESIDEQFELIFKISEELERINIVCEVSKHITKEYANKIIDLYLTIYEALVKKYESNYN